MAAYAGCKEKVVELLYYQHAWYNGNGYPDGIKKGSRIPIGARILAVCDAYEAMVSSRSYKDRQLTPQEVITELRKSSGEQFDPKIVEAFIDIIKESPTQSIH